MSDQQSQPASGETGTSGTGPSGPVISAPNEPVMAAPDVQAARLAPEQEETSPKADAPKLEADRIEAAEVKAPKVEALKAEAPKAEAPKAEASKPEASKAETPKIDAVKAEAPRFPGNVTIMSSGDRVGADAKAAKVETSSDKRRFGAMAAVVALATVAGALGGALATAGIGKLMAEEPAAQAAVKDGALEAAVARIDADIATLKASIEHTAKAGATQLNKANDRLDKVEKAQAEPAAKLAKLSETVDKLRAAQASVTTTAAATSTKEKDVTGSIPQQAAAAPAPAPAAPPKPEVARLPTVEGWVLRDVANGSALIESRRGMYEVYAGDPVPGLGRVDAIRKQDGRWVVVTSKGLIVAR
ncbi:hypothetical protein [Bradyrhizobium sp. BWA-3-5]|uniref:hypothetical protein n=1 Tax=Bradyrhizobium sp. BWA-3-5 TaxID=3080013 RepID=UPI00293EB98A|nr:hypothetical protein [Bradyrhizobium sp. BWA-3-5]WOH65405.1 hypothetical protein RX331_33490 [Bradyrhizobium sp. BWA-3-5]